MARILTGVHSVREALRARPADIEVVYLSAAARGPTLEQVATEAEAAGVRAEWRAPGDLDALAEGRHQGALAVAGPYRYAELADLIGRAQARGDPPLILALDSVQDPHNLGALVRSADALGAHGLVIPSDRAARVTAAVVRASAGATEHCPIARVTNLVRALDELQSAGLWAVAAMPGEEAPPPWELDLTGPIVIVVGSEERGVRPLVARTCDLKTRIPMLGRVASLNVSVAGATLLYEARRQRSFVRRAAAESVPSATEGSE